jgi:hypothetical protein
MSGFLERYRTTEEAVQAYVAGLPVWVNVWRGWMFLVFGLAVVFVFRKREARWLALTMVVSLFAYNVVAMYSGVGRFPSIALVVFWAPLAVWLARRRGAIASATRFDRAYAGWLTACLATLIVSVTFDVYNVAYSLVRGVP